MNNLLLLPLELTFPCRSKTTLEKYILCYCLDLSLLYFQHNSLSRFFSLRCLENKETQSLFIIQSSFHFYSKNMCNLESTTIFFFLRKSVVFPLRFHTFSSRGNFSPFAPANKTSLKKSHIHFRKFTTIFCCCC